MTGQFTALNVASQAGEKAKAEKAKAEKAKAEKAKAEEEAKAKEKAKAEEEAKAGNNNDIAESLAKSIQEFVKRWNKNRDFYKGIEFSLSIFTDELAARIVEILRKMGYDAYFCHDEAIIIILW